MSAWPALFGAAKFKEQYLRILDTLDEEGIIVTKRGEPIARVVHPNPRDLMGALPGIIVDAQDDLCSTGLVWEAELPDDPLERANFITARHAMAAPWRRPR